MEPADATSLVAEARAIFKAQTSSRFRGVTLFRRDNVWIAMFKHKGEVFRLRHRDKEAAARWYDARASRYLGESARLNLHPETGEELCGKRLDSRVEQKLLNRAAHHGQKSTGRAILYAWGSRGIC